MGTKSLSQLAECERGDFAVLSGYPEGEESKWHVNKVAYIGAAGSQTVPVVLQAADASEHWIAVILEQSDGEWTVDDIRAFKEEPPSGMGSGDAGDELDPEEVEVVEITAE